jgi:AcrR family transcriptional regulator
MLTSGNSHSAPRADVRKRPTQVRSRQTVESILDAAAHLLAERGYTATTTNHVAQRAGVSIGSLYQYFPNKDALVVALEEQHLEEAERLLRAEFARWRKDEPDVEAWATSFTRALVAMNDTDLHRVTYNRAPPLPRVRHEVEALVSMTARQVASQLRRFGLGRGAALRAQVLVVAAMAAVHELVIQAPHGPRRNRAERAVRDLVLTYAAIPAGPAAAPPAG